MFKQKDIEKLSAAEIKTYAAELEIENKRLIRAGDMLEQISKLLGGSVNSSAGTTLQAVEAIKSKAVLQDVYTWLAINALKFDAGDWGQEKQIRHLREQSKLATSHLMNISDIYVKPTMFTVCAGKYEGAASVRNYKYCSNAHYTLADALVDYFKNDNYPFCFIEYGDIEITATRVAQ